MLPLESHTIGLPDGSSTSERGSPAIDKTSASTSHDRLRAIGGGQVPWPVMFHARHSCRPPGRCPKYGRQMRPFARVTGSPQPGQA
ncbi:hypothetical protein GGQ85_001461 [Nitrobacter vulgaris]|nr:hypothetical protein [Nitrobacter vulgaris]